MRAACRSCRSCRPAGRPAGRQATPPASAPHQLHPHSSAAVCAVPHQTTHRAGINGVNSCIGACCTFGGVSAATCAALLVELGAGFPAALNNRGDRRQRARVGAGAGAGRAGRPAGWQAGWQQLGRALASCSSKPTRQTNPRPALPCPAPPHPTIPTPSAICPGAGPLTSPLSTM